MTQTALFSDAAQIQTEARHFDKIIVGGGMAGLMAAYEILRAAQAAGKKYRLAVLTARMNAPTAAGSSIELGLDGFAAPHPYRDRINMRLRRGLERLQDIVHHEKIDCRLGMNYQLLGRSKEELETTAQWLVEHFGYRGDEIVPEKIQVAFKGFAAALTLRSSGQINMPEFMRGLAKAIKEMGGTIITGVDYRQQAPGAAAHVVTTDKGDFISRQPPLLALGGEGMRAVESLPTRIIPLYTAALHVALEKADAAIVARAPVGFCDTEISGDIFWGSLDRKNMLTIGFGDVADVRGRDRLEQELRQRLAELLPEVSAKYTGKDALSFGAMACTENKLPVVARCDGFDVISGFGSRGIVPGVAVALDYARWDLHGQDAGLRLWESLNEPGPQRQLQPGVHAPQPGVTPGGGYP